ncbi:hypothetical protein [Aureimonas sp. AU12]|uniref:hypothetical protein n=1 Tax=Aureimonas sp. AU12 TaxID=1638161 RepID=UPI0007807C3B|nr:hypothetical protein [Aureimonas sp. AU12]
MTDGLMNTWEVEASQMRGRPLTKEEKAAIGEEMLKGSLRPDMDKRKRKNAVRNAIDAVRPGKSARAG